MDYGVVRSALSALPMAGDGRPVPLYTIGAIEFLDQVTHACCHIYGASWWVRSFVYRFNTCGCRFVA
eukprot:SAG31_NODE_95_length_25901_cov_24.763700_18_plen_67_part_00